MAPKRRRPGGIEVRTVKRSGGGDGSGGGEREEGSSSHSSGGTGRGGSRAKGTGKPSARYREKAVGAARPGENFYRDAQLASRFEKRVLEIYAPTSNPSESTRELSLRLQKLRDGGSFRLPSLADMCLTVLSDHFDSRVFPRLLSDEAESVPDRRQRKRRRGILGQLVDDDSSDDGDDFVPDEQVTMARPRKGSRVRGRVGGKDGGELLGYLQHRNAYFMTLLPPQLNLALQKRLERQAPQLLTYHVLAKHFVTPSKVAASRICRVLGTEDGTGARGLALLLRSLCVTAPRGLPGSTIASTLRVLHLQAHTRLSTLQLIPLFNETRGLEEVCLRGCISVTSKAVKQLVQSSGQTLRIVNLNWTGVGIEGVEEVIGGCRNVEVLKVAHVQNMNNSTVPAMMERVSRATVEEGIVPLAKLRKLKLHGTDVGNLAVGSILKHCGSNLETLDIGYTQLGGSGSIEILLLMLGLSASGSTHEERNKTLKKMNLSGLSLPSSEIALLSSNVCLFESLRVLDFNDIHAFNRGGGFHDLGKGLDGEVLSTLVGSVCARVSIQGKGAAEHAVLDCTQHAPGTQAQGVPLGPPPYIFERLAVSNKVLGPTWQLSFERLCDCSMQDRFAWLAIRELDLSGLDFAREVERGKPKRTDWLGCQDLNLSGCKLPEEPDWGNLGAAGQVRRIDLSGTIVSETAIDRLLAMNPFVTSINLNGCRGIPVTRRRNYFQATETKR